MYPDIALLILRVVIGGVVMQHGLMKLGAHGKGGSVAGTGKWFDGLGIRPGLLWAIVVVAAEAGGGLLTVLGLGGPIGPALLAGDLLVVTIVAHWPQGFWVMGSKAGWEFTLPLAASALAIALLGSGAYSLDAFLALSYPEWLLLVSLAVVAVGDALALASRAIFAPRQAQQRPA